MKEHVAPPILLRVFKDSNHVNLQHWLGATCKSLGEEAMIAGDWMYRSYLNNPDPVGGDPQKALNDIFGEGVFSLATPAPDTVTGTFDMGGGLILDLRGQISAGTGGPVTVQMAGVGRPGTRTEGWEYDYYAWPAYMWPAGVNQVPSLVGTVLRAKPHNGGKAGVTASFIAVRRPAP
jgi:hypothetical protein